jgi:predicted nucleic acid-binding protein
VKLAADASSVVAESLRVRGEWLIAHSDLTLYITEPTWSEVVHEVGRRLDAMVRNGRLLPTELETVRADRLSLLSRHLTVVTEADYREYEAAARDRIPRDPNDWPTVALALSLGIGVWTNDYDFFGCGVPVWSTETLLTHLASGRAALEA